MFPRIHRLWPTLLALVVLACLVLPVAAQTTDNGITTPAEGATISGQVNVTGNATSPNFSKWQLDLLPEGNPDAAAFLALGATPGELSYTLDTTGWPEGNYALRLRVVRPDGNYDEFLRNVVIAKAAAQPQVSQPIATPPAAAAAAAVAAAGANGISSPKAGASISGQVPVSGQAGGASFMKWQLDLLPNGNPNAAAFLALGTNPGVFTDTLDSTLYPNGPYTLRLRDVRQDANYNEYTNAITITNGTAAGTQATQVITFDPAAYTVDASKPVASANCVASTALPDRGAYACTTTAGAAYDPCFVKQGNELVCPNGAVAVTATGALPAVTKSGSPAPFHVELAPNHPSCDVRGDLNMTLGGQPVTWSCAAPGAWLLDGLNTAQPTWIAQYVTTDSQGVNITFGPEAVAVTKAWVY